MEGVAFGRRRAAVNLTRRGNNNNKRNMPRAPLHSGKKRANTMKTNAAAREKSMATAELKGYTASKRKSNSAKSPYRLLSAAHRAELTNLFERKGVRPEAVLSRVEGRHSTLKRLTREKRPVPTSLENRVIEFEDEHGLERIPLKNMPLKREYLEFLSGEELRWLKNYHYEKRGKRKSSSVDSENGL